VWQSCNVGGMENDFALESFPWWAAVFPGHLLELEVELHRHAEACIPVFWRRKEYIKGWGARNGLQHQAIAGISLESLAYERRRYGGAANS